MFFLPRSSVTLSAHAVVRYYRQGRARRVSVRSKTKCVLNGTDPNHTLCISRPGDPSRTCRPVLASDCGRAQGDSYFHLNHLSLRRTTPPVASSASNPCFSCLAALSL